MIVGMIWKKRQGFSVLFFGSKLDRHGNFWFVKVLV